MSVFRPRVSSTWSEEELWLRLDCALEWAISDPSGAWAIAWDVARDARGFPAVLAATAALLDLLSGSA